MDAEPALKDCRVLLCQLEISSSTTLVALKLAKKHNGLFIFSYYRPQTKPRGAWLPGGYGCWGVCVVAGGARAWLLGGVCGCGRDAWLWGGVHGCGEGACVVVGGMHGCGGCAWLPGGMHRI